MRGVGLGRRETSSLLWLLLGAVLLGIGLELAPCVVLVVLPVVLKPCERSEWRALVTLRVPAPNRSALDQKTPQVRPIILIPPPFVGWWALRSALVCHLGEGLLHLGGFLQESRAE